MTKFEESVRKIEEVRDAIGGEWAGGEERIKTLAMEGFDAVAKALWELDRGLRGVYDRTDSMA